MAHIHIAFSPPQATEKLLQCASHVLPEIQKHATRLLRVAGAREASAPSERRTGLYARQDGWRQDPECPDHVLQALQDKGVALPLRKEADTAALDTSWPSMSRAPDNLELSLSRGPVAALQDQLNSKTRTHVAPPGLLGGTKIRDTKDRQWHCSTTKLGSGGFGQVCVRARARV